MMDLQQVFRWWWSVLTAFRCLWSVLTEFRCLWSVLPSGVYSLYLLQVLMVCTASPCVDGLYCLPSGWWSVLPPHDVLMVCTASPCVDGLYCLPYDVLMVCTAFPMMCWWSVLPPPGWRWRTSGCCGRRGPSARRRAPPCPWCWPAPPAGSGPVCPTSTPCWGSGPAWATWTLWGCCTPRESARSAGTP